MKTPYLIKMATDDIKGKYVVVHPKHLYSVDSMTTRAPRHPVYSPLDYILDKKHGDDPSKYKITLPKDPKDTLKYLHTFRRKIDKNAPDSVAAEVHNIILSHAKDDIRSYESHKESAKLQRPLQGAIAGGLVGATGGLITDHIKRLRKKPFSAKWTKRLGAGGLVAGAAYGVAHLIGDPPKSSKNKAITSISTLNSDTSVLLRESNRVKKASPKAREIMKQLRSHGISKAFGSIGYPYGEREIPNPDDPILRKQLSRELNKNVFRGYI